MLSKNKPVSHSDQKLHGFTLIELIMVIVLVGIIAIYVAPKLSSTDDFKDDAEAASFISRVRFVQHRAMVSGGGFRIEFTGSSYRMLDNGNNIERFPDLTTDAVSLDSISASASPVYFNFLGQPTDNLGALLTADVTVTLGGKTFVITPYAGGVYEQ